MRNNNSALHAATVLLCVALSGCASMADVSSTSKPRDAASLGLDIAAAGTPVTEQW